MIGTHLGSYEIIASLGGETRRRASRLRVVGSVDQDLVLPR